MIRPVLSLERLSFLEQVGKVGYRRGRDGAEQEAMNYLEFITRVTSHIPDKGQVMVRYHGLYANAHPILQAGCAHGGRGERGIFFKGAAEFLVATRSSGIDFRGD